MSYPTPFTRPERCPAGYVMHFYCKYRNEDHRLTPAYPGLFEESDQCETRGDALRQARESGWIIHRDETATCPLCRKQIQARKQSSNGEGV